MPTILVVDDSALARDAVAKLFEYEGFKVLRAGHGRDAWAMMYQHTPDLVLLDLMMPEMDGVTLLHMIRDSVRWRDLPVIVLTGATDQNMLIKRACELKIQDLIPKSSFGFDDLLARVNPPPRASTEPSGYAAGSSRGFFPRFSPPTQTSKLPPKELRIMKYRKLGATDVKVSEISFGCWTMGGLNWVNGSPNGWANVNEDDITAGIKSAIDACVNHFDNADVYGNGRAERMLTRVFQKLGVKTNDFVIATKIGHFPGTADHAYEPAHIRHQCEQSLINLKRDYIDLYYLHHGDFGPDAQYLHGAADTLDRLTKEGKIRLKGQSAYSEADFERAVPIVKPVVLQSWAHALDDHFIKPGSRVDQLMQKWNINFVAFSPLAQARLLDKFDPKNPPQFEPGDHRLGNKSFGPEEIAKLKPRLEKLKKRFGSTTEDLASMALNYLLAFPRVACVIPGFRNDRQARCNLQASGRSITGEDVKFIQETLAG
jgi:myo-inositol catabolism protein IolS